MKTIGDLIYRAVQIARRRRIDASELALEDGRYLVVVLPLPEDGRFDHRWKNTFLGWLKHGLTVQQSAELAGVSRKHAYNSRRLDPAFRKAWDEVRNKQ